MTEVYRKILKGSDFAEERISLEIESKKLELKELEFKKKIATKDIIELKELLIEVKG